MQQQLTIKLLPSEAASEDIIRDYISNALSIKKSSINGFTLLKKSIDARSKQAYVLITLNAFIDEPFHQRKIQTILLKRLLPEAPSAIIAGAGPAGLFAAIKFIELGIKPVILERGKEIRARRRDLARLNKEGTINPESNYCFGEGGAGTYSDGKLYTRSNKRGDIERILNILVQFGADEKILYEAHPHIGTNKLPAIITAIRDAIIDAGGQIHFQKKISDLETTGDQLTAVTCADGDRFECKTLVLATGHSARDIFRLLSSKNILIEPKPFALGVRVEHPQQLIDNIQYHCPARGEYLPPASYSLVHQYNDRGIFSFCMCPGGIIAPASTDPGELVVNGWSPSKRNNPFANSGMVVAVNDSDFAHLTNKYGALAAIEFQRSVEVSAFEHGGGNFVAPAQRLADFSNKKLSADLPETSYLPGVRPALLHQVLPPFVYKALAEGFKAFDKKMRGYYTNEAVVVATESRTSSPVKIPRDRDTLEHPQIRGLFPCGEGAGYAGGIMSAAMDGERVASKVAEKQFKKSLTAL